MKQIILITFFLFNNLAISQSFYDLNINSIDGESISFAQFKGKYVLIVNVASRCGYTSQYADLQKLSQTYNDLIVIGVPCNQFANQEPKSELEIMEFCSNTFQVSFPMTEKVNVRGRDQHEVYQWLTSKELNELDDFKVSWNFNKFLINKQGELISYFPSRIKPMSVEIVSLIKE